MSVFLFIAAATAVSWRVPRHHEYVTMEEIVASADPATVQPPLRDSRIPFGTAAGLLSAAGPFSAFGPLSSFGALGVLGPLGSDSWNPQQVLGSLASLLNDTAVAGTCKDPLGYCGPLGVNGAGSEVQFFGKADPGKTLFAQNDFAVHLRGLCYFSALGPLGPLGPFGPLGPLGPLSPAIWSSFQLELNSDGSMADYLTKAIVRTLDLPFSPAENRTFPLFEVYAEAAATGARARDLDTSFGVYGEIDMDANGDPISDTFTFVSSEQQLVTIAVVPEKSLDDFDLQLNSTASGTIVATSTSGLWMDWIQVQSAANEAFSITVSLGNSAHLLTKTYRLFVVGSGVRLDQVQCKGV
jgi:hypothetical protein